MGDSGRVVNSLDFCPASLKHEQQVIAYFQTHDYVPQKMSLTLAV